MSVFGLGTAFGIYALVIAAVLGACTGSFVNCWAWRSSHGLSVLEGRSKCPACGHELGLKDLVPVFSWLASKGKCRYCGKPVAKRYLVVELLAAAVFAGLVASYGLSAEAVELCAFAAVLLFVSLVDIETYRIPNAALLVALGIRLAYMAYAIATGSMTWPEAGMYAASGAGTLAVLLIIVLVMDKVLGKDSMGGGDIKLFAVAALYFGWAQLLLLIVVSCLFGFIVYFTVPVKDPKVSDDAPEDSEKSTIDDKPPVPAAAFPFGPSIAAACVVVMFAGPPFVIWYEGLIGDTIG